MKSIICGEGSKVSNKEYLEKEQGLYEQHADQLGRKVQATIEAGLNPTIALRSANHRIEAESLL